MPILEGQGVTKYFGGLAAVSSVDFHVDQLNKVSSVPNAGQKIGSG